MPLPLEFCIIRYFKNLFEPVILIALIPFPSFLSLEHLKSIIGYSLLDCFNPIIPPVCIFDNSNFDFLVILIIGVFI